MRLERNEKLMRRYVLSAGRTGTVFLTHLLNQIEGITAAHEPSPTRWQMMLANMRNDRGIGGRALAGWFNATRWVDKASEDRRVELNPFLCALADLVPEESVETRIVHVVRHPLDWATSMSIFKASTRYRHVIDYVPFAKPYPSPRPAGWSRMHEVEKALWRWKWCNERILEAGKQVARFETIRSEDLLSSNSQISEAAAKVLFDCLDLPGALPNGFAAQATNRNPRPDGEIEVPDGAVARICGPLAKQLGYEI